MVAEVESAVGTASSVSSMNPDGTMQGNEVAIYRILCEFQVAFRKQRRRMTDECSSIDPVGSRSTCQSPNQLIRERVAVSGHYASDQLLMDRASKFQGLFAHRCKRL